VTSDRRAWLVVAAVAALGYLVLLDVAPAAGLAVLKPVPVLCLAAWCGLGTARAQRLLCVGLVVCAVGDVLLVFPSLFLAGVGVFFLAHLCYTAAFLALTRRWQPWRALPFVAWGVGAYAFLFPVLGGLVVPVGAYIVAICVMMWRAAACAGATGAPRAERWALAGAVVFGLSDTVLALNRFYQPWPDAPYVIMVLYWAGQAGLAASARRATGISTAFQYHHAGPPAA
jgi:uncharacterized membrane protein YhhN